MTERLNMSNNLRGLMRAVTEESTLEMTQVSDGQVFATSRVENGPFQVLDHVGAKVLVKPGTLTVRLFSHDLRMKNFAATLVLKPYG